METQEINNINRTQTQWGARNWWVSSLDDCWHHEHRDLDYQHQPFNSAADVAAWLAAGYPPQPFTGDLYDMRRPEPCCISSIRQQMPMREFSWAFYRMKPGDILPKHQDTYARFREIHGLDSDTQICRCIVFLEHWDSGHYFEIDGVPFTGWSKGTTVSWLDDVPHIAANIGMTARYTLQLTGLA